MYAVTRISQRMTPPKKVCANSGSSPVTSAANHPITATTKAAIQRKNRTMNCGMARMMRNTTVTRFCGAVPAYHMSTRPVGTGIEALVMSAPLSAARRCGQAHGER